MNVPGFDRLGIPSIIREHLATLYWVDSEDRPHRREADRVVLHLFPILAGVLSMFFRLPLYDTSPFLNGVAILAGGLFTLLVAIFGVSAAGLKGPDFEVVRRLIRETRANVTYATGWALMVVMVLAVIQGFRAPAAPNASLAPLPCWLTGIVVVMLLHLLLVLFMVLNRIRLAFAELSKHQ